MSNLILEFNNLLQKSNITIMPNDGNSIDLKLTNQTLLISIIQYLYLSQGVKYNLDEFRKQFNLNKFTEHIDFNNNISYFSKLLHQIFEYYKIVVVFYDIKLDTNYQPKIISNYTPLISHFDVLNFSIVPIGIFESKFHLILTESLFNSKINTFINNNIPNDNNINNIPINNNTSNNNNIPINNIINNNTINITSNNNNTLTIIELTKSISNLDNVNIQLEKKYEKTLILKEEYLNYFNDTAKTHQLIKELVNQSQIDAYYETLIEEYTEKFNILKLFDCKIDYKTFISINLKQKIKIITSVFNNKLDLYFENITHNLNEIDNLKLLINKLYE